MADLKKPVEEVSAQEAQEMFANAAKALGGNKARSAGFHRVSIPVEKPMRPAEIEEPETVRTYEPEVREYEPEEEERYALGATTIIPSAVVFDSYEEYDEEEEEWEPSSADIEEEVAFSALEEALNRHAQVYGDMGERRRHRYHDYGFGMGITFDGPSYFDDED